MVYESKYRPTHYAYGDELMHYGVPGMKWGKRKAVRYERQARKIDQKANGARLMGSMQRSAQAQSKSALGQKAYGVNASYYEKRANRLTAKANRVGTTLERKQAISDAKSAYKSAKKDYNKSFNKAYNKAGQAYSLSAKKRQANDARWEDAANKADALAIAKAAYKKTKADYRR